MDRRVIQANTASRVQKAITAAGQTVASISKATGISLSVLNGLKPYTVADLGSVGGFLHVHPAQLIGAAE